jgi:hypothetical protein
MYCWAFWIATGKGDASATAPKKSTSSSSVTACPVCGGCRITQVAPCSAAARTKAICSAGVAPNTVIASGRRPARSSAAHTITCRRSSGASFLTSVPRAERGDAVDAAGDAVLDLRAHRAAIEPARRAEERVQHRIHARERHPLDHRPCRPLPATIVGPVTRSATRQSSSEEPWSAAGSRTPARRPPASLGS